MTIKSKMEDTKKTSILLLLFPNIEQTIKMYYYGGTREN